MQRQEMQRQQLNEQNTKEDKTKPKNELEINSSKMDKKLETNGSQNLFIKKDNMNIPVYKDDVPTNDIPIYKSHANIA